MSYVGNVPTTAAFPFDQFSGNGSTTAFTLSYAPAGSTSIIVSISGVVQNPNTYSVSGTTLTFTPAPPTGTNNIAVLYLGLPVIGVSTPGNTAYFSSSVFTATASQTVFTPSGTYQVGFINVIRNGSQLAPADYTATNGTTVTLANPCTAGDTVVIEVFNLVSIANAIPATGGAFTGAVSGTTFTGTSFSTATGTLYPLVSGTAQASTSGTSINFTDIPATAKRITVMFSGVSTNGTNYIFVQAGTGSTPTYTTSGYLAQITTTGASSINTAAQTTGFGVINPSTNAELYGGSFVLTNLSGNVWSGVGSTACTTGTRQVLSSGVISLAATLTAVRVTSADTFDAGTINIMWE